MVDLLVALTHLIARHPALHLSMHKAYLERTLQEWTGQYRAEIHGIHAMQSKYVLEFRAQHIVATVLNQISGARKTDRFREC